MEDQGWRITLRCNLVIYAMKVGSGWKRLRIVSHCRVSCPYLYPLMTFEPVDGLPRNFVRTLETIQLSYC